MNEDFKLKDDNNSFISDFMKEDSTLPPRSSIHNPQGTEKSGSNKPFRMFFSSFVFVIIIAVILFFVFSDSFRTNDIDKDLEGNGTKPIENGDVVGDNDNQLDPDDIIIDIDPSESDQDVGGDVIVDDIPIIPTVPIVPQEPTVPAETPSVNQEITHIVKAGENLYKISLQYYGPGYLEELAKYNNIVNSEYITAGTVLKIPDKKLLK